MMGASGSGKSSCLPGLRQKQPHIDWRDFDDAPVHPTSTAERQMMTEYWLTVAAQYQAEGISTGIAGTVVLGEMLACPSAPSIGTVHATLLDCADLTRIDRIRSRDGLAAKSASQDMLCWSAWLRMHAADPQWRQDVVRDLGAPDMRWERWDKWTRGDARWKVDVLDNTGLTVEQTTDVLNSWIGEHIASHEG